MPGDKRLIYSRKWFEKGIKTEDPFDKFIYLWIALVIAAQYRRVSGDSDREKIVNLFRGRSSLVFKVIKKHHEGMAKLAQRRGSKYKGPIVDTGNRELRAKFSKIADFYDGKIRLSEDVFVGYVGELLNKIRNNLFHGGKVYDDKEDIALINLVNPILQDVIGRSLY